MSVRGWAIEARWEDQKTELTADVSTSATTLPVEWTELFDSAGGVLELNDVRYNYIEVDDDADTITLDSGLLAGAAIDDPVFVVEGGQVAREYTLVVSLGEGDPVEVPISFAERDLWPEGVYDDPVPVVLSDDHELILEVPNRTPERIGSFIDPATLPPPPTSDGNPPSVATTVTVRGGIGSLAITWNEIVNNDPVTYRLHVAAGADPATDGTDEVVAGVGVTAAMVRNLPDGSPVVADGSVTYHAIVTVEDADGPGPASAAASGVPAQVTGPDIAASVVTTDFLLSNEAFIGALNAVDMSAVTMTAPHIRTEVEDDRGVHFDVNGIRAYPPAGGAPFFEVNPVLGFLILTGEATLNRLTAVTETELRGAVEVAAGTTMTLASGTTPPKNSPNVGSSYETLTFTNDGDWPNRMGLAFDGTHYWTYNNATRQFETWNGDGTLHDGSVADGVDVMASVSLAQGGGKVYAVAVNTDGFAAQFFVFDAATVTLLNFELWLQYQNGGRDPAVAYDPTPGATDPVLIAQCQLSTDQVRVRSYHLDGSNDLVHNATTDLGAFAINLRSMAYSPEIGGGTPNPSFDFAAAGPSRYMMTGPTSTNAFFMSTSGRRTDEDFPLAIGDKVGVIWDETAGEFRSLNNGGVMRTYTGLDKDVATGAASTTKWISTAYYRSTGPWETLQSPKYKYTAFPKRSRMRVTGPELPDTPGTNDPDQLRIYVGSGTTEPSDANMHRQTSPATGLSEIIYEALTTGGGNPDGGTPFPSSGPSELVSDTEDADGPIVNIESTGTVARVRDLTFTPPMFLGQRTSTTQSLTTGVETLIGWNILEEYGLSISGNVVTIARAGLYKVVLSLGYDNASTTGRRDVVIKKNGTTYASQSMPGSALNAAGATMTVERHIPCAAGDTLAGYGFQASGGNLNVLGSGALTFFDIVYVGDNPL